MVRATRARAEEEDANEFATEPSAALSLAARTRGQVIETASTPERNTPPASPLVPVMTGTHFHQLDEKGRVIIPAKLRPALTEQFWLMIDENDNIGIYNYQTGLDIMVHYESMMAEYPNNENIAAAVERSTGAAELLTAEGNWRVQVPDLLRFQADLDKEVVTVGVLNHAVMWSREKWEAAQMRRLQNPDVRRAQAEMMRAAASGIRKKAHEQARQIEAETFAREEAVSAGPERVGRSSNAGDGTGNADIDASGRPVKTAASAGDGKRSPRVLTLSQLGR